MKEGWTYKKLAEVCDVQNGFAFNSKLFGSEPIGMPLIRIRDIKRGFSETYTSESCGEEFIVSNGDCLIGMDGDFNVGIWKGGTALLNQRVCKLVPSDKVSLKFLYYYIPERLNEINSKTVFTTVKHLSSKQIKEIGVPDISLSEQKRIVSYLDSTFAKIEAVAKNAEESLNQAKALFQSALAKMMEPKDGWKKKKLGEVLNLRRGHDLTHSQMEDGDIVVAGSNGPIGFHNVATPISPCITIGRSGSVGSVNMYDKCWAHNTTLYIDDFKGNNPKYLYYILTSLNLAKLNSGSAVPTLNRNFIHPISIPFVKDVSKQKAIVATLDSLKSKVDQLQDNLSRTLTECTALKQSILRQTFE